MGNGSSEYTLEWERLSSWEGGVVGTRRAGSGTFSSQEAKHPDRVLQEASSMLQPREVLKIRSGY